MEGALLPLPLTCPGPAYHSLNFSPLLPCLSHLLESGQSCIEQHSHMLPVGVKYGAAGREDAEDADPGVGTESTLE